VRGQEGVTQAVLYQFGTDWSGLEGFRTRDDPAKAGP